MKCPRCRLVMQTHDRVPGLQVCPDEGCGATVLLVDAGYQPSALPVFTEPSPYAETEPVVHSTMKQKITPQPPRLCEWQLCGVEFVPTHAHQRYHAIKCRDAAKLQREGGRKTDRRESEAPEFVAANQ